MKKILFLGASELQTAPLWYAKKKGYRIITCDNQPKNPGHLIAHESYNISTTDKEEVLNLGRKLKIDGIVAYGSDPAAPTASYVAEKMNLIGNPYNAVLTLTRKDFFRKFLKKNGFNVPLSKSFSDRYKAKNWLKKLKLPVFIKPVDSSGSKGITQIKSYHQFESAFNHALAFSRKKKVIVEEKIYRKGYQVAGDGFVINGNLVFHCWANEHFNKNINGIVPIGESFPSIQNKSLLLRAVSETQRLINLVGYKVGAINFDFIFNRNEELFFLELGPRNGGCLIPEVIKYATGVDLVSLTVESALFDQNFKQLNNHTEGFWSSFMIHSAHDGIFKELNISKKIKNKIVEKRLFINIGNPVKKFLGSNEIIGAMIIRFNNLEEMVKIMDDIDRYIYVKTF